MRDPLPVPDLPLPDLDGGGPSSSSATWRVRASAFRDPVGDAERVAVALGLELSEAQRLVASAPVFVGEGSRREEAERIAAALAGLGAKVVVEDASAPRSAPPPASGPRSTAPSRAQESSEDDAEWERSFWAELPMAFLAPVLGMGVLPILGAGVLGVLGWFVLLYVPGFVKLFAGVAAILTGVGLVIEVFAKLAQAAHGRDRGSLPAPHFAMPELSALALRGLTTVIVLVVFGAMLWFVAQSGIAVLTLAVALLIGAYWPLGLAIQGVSGRFFGIFDLPAAVRSIAIAPLEYLAVVGVSYVLLVGLSFALAYGGMLAVGAIEAPVIMEIVVAFLYFAALTYAHGVLGYAMGALIAAKEERFAFLVE